LESIGVTFELNVIEWSVDALKSAFPLTYSNSMTLEASSVGALTNGETLTGGSSGNTAKLLQHRTVGNKHYLDLTDIRYIEEGHPFIHEETLTGSTSNKTAVVESVTTALHIFQISQVGGSNTCWFKFEPLALSKAATVEIPKARFSDDLVIPFSYEIGKFALKGVGMKKSGYSPIIIHLPGVCI
jgi:hypothetical protein